jgi:hypothetical protein
MKDIDVIPIYRKENDSYIFVGSGFFFTDRLLATAGHVSHQGGRFLKIRNQFIKSDVAFYKYRTHLAPDADDIAILQVPDDLASQHYWHLAPTEPPIGAACQIVGFPGAGKALHELPCLMGCEESETPLNGNNIHLHGWANDLLEGSLGGMSGGPIIDKENQVIGLLANGQRIVGSSATNPKYKITATSTARILRAVEEINARKISDTSEAPTDKNQ